MVKVKQMKSNRKPKAQKKKNNMRQRKRRTNLNAARTPSTIIKSLRRNGNNLPMIAGHPYVRAMMDPFHAPPNVAIPDGANSNFITSQIYTINNINGLSANQTIVIQTLPALPALAMIGSTTIFSVDGALIGPLGGGFSPNATIGADGVAKNRAYYPIAIPTPFAGVDFIPGVSVDDPYLSSKARMVCVAYELTYTGPATTCAGYISITPSDVAFVPSGSAGGAGEITVYGATPTNTRNAAAFFPGTPILNLDINLDPTSITRQSTIVRPETPVYIVPRHRTADFKIYPTADVPSAVLANAGPTAIGGTTLINALSGNTNGKQGVIWYDNDWESFQISISGINADASYILRTISIFEYNPTLSSAFASLTINTTVPMPDVLAGAKMALDAGNGVKLG